MKKRMSNIFRFFLKRAGIFYTAALIICLAFGDQRLKMSVALTLGVLLSLLRLAIFDAILGVLISKASKNQAIFISIVIYLLNLVIIGITIVFALQFGIGVFIAALAGILSTMIIVMINGITEAFGITKNHYGQKVK